MQSCRQEILKYNEIYENNITKINSIAKTYLISGIVLLIIISIAIIKEELLTYSMDNNLILLGIIGLTILFAAILLIIYGILLKVRNKTFSNSIQVYEDNNLLKMTAKINTFAMEIQNDNITYYDASNNSNGLNLLLIPLLISCIFYSHNSIILGIDILLVIISLAVFIMTHCFPDKLNNYFKDDIRSKKGFKKFFLFAHITLLTTIMVVLLTFII